MGAHIVKTIKRALQDRDHGALLLADWLLKTQHEQAGQAEVGTRLPPKQTSDDEARCWEPEVLETALRFVHEILAKGQPRGGDDSPTKISPEDAWRALVEPREGSCPLNAFSALGSAGKALARLML